MVQTEIGSLDCPQNIDRAVDILKQGGYVGAQVHGVFGLWADAQNRNALQAMLAAKGDTSNKVFSLMMSYTYFTKFVDQQRVHPAISPLICQPELLDHLTGALIHLRLPIKLPTRLPSSVHQNGITHNLSLHHHPIDNLVSAMRDAHMPFAAMTTMNRHGEAEFTNLQEFPVGLILTDPHYSSDTQFQGSLTVVDTLTARVHRKGRLPTATTIALLGFQLNDQGSPEPKYPISPFQPETQTSGEELANVMRAFAQGLLSHA